ncbi:MAG: hypothetical protein IJ087_09240 [Eggerthellaceae bacterium]|nr:hypothetical protein [Eggerthellaceae bacterium]
MNDGGLMTMKEIRDALEACLAREKVRLVTALAEQLDDDGERVAGEYGARGRMLSSGLLGTFHVNCNRKGEPSREIMKEFAVGWGSGEGLHHYHWIPVVYRDGVRERCYVLALCREDLDVNSGNLHVDFAQLQMTRPSYAGSEIGGQANPAPEPVEGGYLLNYRSDDSFPRAVRDYGENRQPRTVLDDDRPWGYSGFEGQIPTLDLADPAYDPRKVAAFFMRLIMRDLGA